ncbi:MAG: hypothetical protein AAGC60_26465 [Acidobacteriota bacterium]
MISSHLPSKPTVRAFGLLSVALALLGLGDVRAADAPRPEAGAAIESADHQVLIDWAEAVGRVESLHFRATSRIQGRPNGFEGSGVAVLELWEHEDKYRLTSTVDDDLVEIGVFGSTDLSWDGEIALMKTPIGDEIALREAPHEVLLASAPNPLQLAFGYLWAATAGPADRLTLVRDLAASAGSAPTVRVVAAHAVETEPQPMPRDERAVAVLADVQVDGSTHRLPVWLRMVEGQGVTTVRIEEYLERDGVLFPSRLSWNAADSPDSHATLRGSMSIEHFEVNRPIDPSVFRLEVPVGIALYHADQERLLDEESAARLLGATDH